MSQINWNRQLGLALALFILGTAAYWLEFKHKPAQEASEEQVKHVFQIKDTQVDSIALNDGTKNVVFGCVDTSAKLCKPGDNSKWEITDPSKLKADDANVNALVSTLSNLNPNETIDLKEETAEKRAALLKEYGLDAESRKSNRKVQVITKDGSTVLYLGQPHPIGDSIFALKENVAAGQKPTGSVNENQVFLIPNYFKANLEHDLTYWRDKKLLALNAHEVESFKLDSSKTHFTALKKDGSWVLQAGKDELAGDLEAIDAFLNSLVYLNAKNFASDQKNDAKAKTVLKGYFPMITLTLQKEKGTAKEAPAPFTLTFYQQKPTQDQPSGKVLATVSHLDPLFELEGMVINRLDKSVKDFRLNKLVTSADRFGAKRLEFSGTPIGDTSLILVNKDGKWVNQTDQSEVSSEKVQNLMDKISGNRIKDFLSGTSIPAGEKDGLKFTLGDDKSETKRQLIFWKKDEKLYARDLQSKRGDVFLIDSSVRDSLPWNKNFFKVSDSKAGAKLDNSKK